MAGERKKVSKSETLTIRLDPRTRFQLEFIARLRGQTITTVVERAILEAADNARIRVDDFSPDLTWQSIWHVNEGARSLSLAQHPGLYPTFEEERRLSFAKEHWPFFFENIKFDTYRLYYLEVLWPRIDEFIDIFDKTKNENYFAAGEAMRQCLEQAKLKAPDWPIKSAPAPKSEHEGLDGDIPF